MCRASAKMMALIAEYNQDTASTAPSLSSNERQNMWQKLDVGR